jgi:hypothetical protein
LSARRREAPTGPELSRTRERSSEAAKDEKGQSPQRLDAKREPVGTEVDASLRPLAKALLALAEQMSQEEGP